MFQAKGAASAKLWDENVLDPFQEQQGGQGGWEAVRERPEWNEIGEAAEGHIMRGFVGLWILYSGGGKLWETWE